MHKYGLSSIMAISLLFSACKPTKQEMLRGKWKAIGMQSPQLEQEIKDTRNFIDTVGKSTNPEENLELYGVSNMDSLRAFMKEKLEGTLTEQKRLIDNTRLDFFTKDEVATNFGSEEDTINWYLDDEGALIFDEMKKKGSGSKINMEIVKLEKDSLHLRFNENGYSSTAIFIKQ